MLPVSIIILGGFWGFSAWIGLRGVVNLAGIMGVGRPGDSSVPVSSGTARPSRSAPAQYRPDLAVHPLPLGSSPEGNVG